MRLNNLSEARYNVGKPDMRHVFQVAKAYDMHATNGSAATKAGNRQSDYELWDSGKPSINTFGTLGEGLTGLKFIFQNKSEEDSLYWVKDYISTVRLPYTSIESFPPTQAPFAVDDEEEIPTYTRVDVRYQEHPDNA